MTPEEKTDIWNKVNGRLDYLYKGLEKVYRELDIAMGVVSHTQSQLCYTIFGEHSWEAKEPNKTFDIPWKQCRRCGCVQTK